MTAGRGGWDLNLPAYTASDLVPCPGDCRERFPHHHFLPGGRWVGGCCKDTPGEKCICESIG